MRIKVVGETPKANPLATSVAECRKCGDQQVISAGRILSITIEEDETAPKTGYCVTTVLGEVISRFWRVPQFA
jgi:hypothetical protein